MDPLRNSSKFFFYKNFVQEFLPIFQDFFQKCLQGRNNVLLVFFRNTSRDTSIKYTRDSFRKPSEDSFGNFRRFLFRYSSINSIESFLKKLPENLPGVPPEIYVEWLSGSLLCFFLGIITKIPLENLPWIAYEFPQGILSIFLECNPRCFPGNFWKFCHGIRLGVFTQHFLKISSRKSD